MRNPFPDFILLAYIITVGVCPHYARLLCANITNVLALYSELVILVTNFNAHFSLLTSSFRKSLMPSRQGSC